MEVLKKSQLNGRYNYDGVKNKGYESMAPLYTVRVLTGNRWHPQMGEFGGSLKN